MAFDENRVRIELCDAIGVTRDASLAHYQAAEIWLPGREHGTVSRTRKPAIRLVAGRRSELLQQLATWLELHPDDQGFQDLAAEQADAFTEAKNRG